MIHEITCHHVMRLWVSYLAEGDYLPEYLLVHISCQTSCRDWICKEMVMFLQCLLTRTWANHELEMVLSTAYMWCTSFKSSPIHPYEHSSCLELEAATGLRNGYTSSEAGTI
ncbi:hypothetical protein BS78_05G131100 [Paspalum vaginatum]|nr:hypothetical protein BS78_05G131100 [Paspalum vaginatum]